MGRIRANSIGGREHEVDLSPGVKPNDLARLGGGYTKHYFYDKTADPPAKYGWLCFKALEHKTAELKAYGALAQKNRQLLPAMFDATPEVNQPRGLKHDGQAVGDYGVWVEHIKGEFFKPKMSGSPLLGQNINKNTLKAIRASKNIKETIEGLKRVQENFDDICKTVGEVTLAIDAESGKVYLVDLGKIGGQAADNDKDPILNGLNKIAMAAEKEAKDRDNIVGKEKGQIQISIAQTKDGKTESESRAAPDQTTTGGEATTSSATGEATSSNTI